MHNLEEAIVPRSGAYVFRLQNGWSHEWISSFRLDCGSCKLHLSGRLSTSTTTWELKGTNSFIPLKDYAWIWPLSSRFIISCYFYAAVDRRVAACEIQEIRAVTSGVSGLAEVNLPTSDQSELIKLPPGRYPVEIRSDRTNCTINITVAGECLFSERFFSLK